MVYGNMSLVAGNVLEGQRELVALLQHDLAILELTKTHLRALSVKDQGNHLASLLGSFAHHVDAAQVLLMVAMGEVETGAVHAVLDELLNDARLLRSRSLGADDFRLL